MSKILMGSYDARPNPLVRIRRVGTLTVFAVLLLVGATAAEAAFTGDACFARTRMAWGHYRACRAVEDAKRLEGRTADPNQCPDQLVARLAGGDGIGPGGSAFTFPGYAQRLRPLLSPGWGGRKVRVREPLRLAAAGRA
jgi:hypothetical protein